MRAAVIEFRDITEADEKYSTIVHTLNGSPWCSYKAEMATIFKDMPFGGGGDYDETPLDAFGALLKGNGIRFQPVADAFRLAVLITDNGYKINNNYGYTSLGQVCEDLIFQSISTSVIAPAGEQKQYQELYQRTGGVCADREKMVETIGAWMESALPTTAEEWKIGTFSNNGFPIRIQREGTFAPIAGASVRVNGTSYTTNANGAVLIPGNGAETMTCSVGVSATNHYDYPAQTLTLQRNKETTLVLVPRGMDADGISAVTCNGIEVLAGTQNAAWNSGVIWDVKVSSYLAASEVAEYQLLNDGKVIATDPGGAFQLKVADLSVGKPVWVRLKKADGTLCKAVKTGMSVYNTFAQIQEDDAKISIGGSKITVTLPDDVPLMGGREFELDLGGAVPVFYEIEGDTYRIGIGVEEKNGKVEWFTLKRLCDSVKEDYHSGMEALREAAQHGHMTMGNQPEVKISVFGYGEGKIVNGGPNPNDTIVVKCLIKAKWWKQEWQTFLLEIPIVIKAEFGSELDARYVGKVDPVRKRFVSSASIKLTPIYAKPSVGIGITKIADVSVYGRVGLNVSVDTGTDYHYGELEGEVGVSAKFLIFEDEWPILQGVKRLWEGYGDRVTASERKEQNAGISIDSSGRVNLSAMAGSDGLLDPADFTLASRDYLTGANVLPSVVSQQERDTITWADPGTTRVTALQSNIYDGAWPCMCRAGSDIVLVWLTDDGTRTAENRTMLVYSLYNASTSAWSDPLSVWDDHTADFYPSLATDGTNIYVAWQDSRSTFAAGTTLAQMAAAGEISLAKFDGASKSFVNKVHLTNDTVLDTQPAVAVVNGTPHVVWSRNENNDILNQTGSNSIWYSMGGMASQVKGGLNPIARVDVGLLGGNIRIAYVEDEDGLVTTPEDTVLYLSNTTGSAVQVEAEAGSASFERVCGIDRLCYITADTLMSTTNSSAGTALLPEGVMCDNFCVLNGAANETAVMTIQPQENTKNTIANVYLYDQTSRDWGLIAPFCGLQRLWIPIFRDAPAVRDSDQIAIQPDLSYSTYLKYPSGVIGTDGRIHCAYTSSNAKISGTDIVTYTDLCVAERTPAYDVVLENVGYDLDAVTGSAVLPLVLTVRNKGERAVNSLTVSINGTSQTVAVAIPLGATKDVTVNYTLPATIEPGEYTVSILGLSGEISTADNTATVMMGYTDLSVDVTRAAVSGAVTAGIGISNRSAVPTGCTLEIRANDATGDVLATRELEEIAAGQTTMVYLAPADVKKLKNDGNTNLLYIAATADESEYATGDNSGLLAIPNSLETYLACGDTNADGAVTVRDAVVLCRHIANAQSIYGDCAAAGDANGDDKLDVRDVLQICRYVAGVVESLPA